MSGGSPNTGPDVGPLEKWGDNRHLAGDDARSGHRPIDGDCRPSQYECWIKEGGNRSCEPGSGCLIRSL